MGVENAWVVGRACWLLALPHFDGGSSRPQVKSHLTSGGHSVVYAEDILKLNSAVARPSEDIDEIQVMLLALKAVVCLQRCSTTLVKQQERVCLQRCCMAEELQMVLRKGLR